MTIQWRMLRRWMCRAGRERLLDLFLIVLQTPVLVGSAGVLVEEGRETVEEGRPWEEPEEGPP